MCIHPFRDGNGRVSRLLTSLLLLQEGFDIGKYISIDKKINEYRYNYYQALKACSDGWHENRNTYIPFITYLLQILYSCYKDLDSKFIENSAQKISKSQLIENTLMQSFVPVSKEEIKARFPEISITTVEREYLGNWSGKERLKRSAHFAMRDTGNCNVQDAVAAIRA